LSHVPPVLPLILFFSEKIRFPEKRDPPKGHFYVILDHSCPSVPVSIFLGGIFVLKLFKDLSEPEGDPLLSSWTGKSETRGALVLKEGPCGPVCTVFSFETDSTQGCLNRHVYLHNTLPKGDTSEGVQRVPKPEK